MVGVIYNLSMPYASPHYEVMSLFVVVLQQIPYRKHKIRTMNKGTLGTEQTDYILCLSLLKQKPLDEIIFFRLWISVSTVGKDRSVGKEIYDTFPLGDMCIDASSAIYLSVFSGSIIFIFFTALGPFYIKAQIIQRLVGISFDSWGRPIVTAGSDDHCFHTCRPSVRPSSLFKTEQCSSENNVRYWQDCESGRVDHWWHLSYTFSCFSHWQQVYVRIVIKGIKYGIKLCDFNTALS